MEIIPGSASKGMLESWNREKPRTPEEEAYFSQRISDLYGIEPEDHPELAEYLLDFAEDGASTATMRLLARLNP